MCKLHICRLSVALAVSLKMHLRMAEMTAQGEHRAPASSVRYALFDLLRIKGLLSGSEAKLVEAHCGLVEEEDGGKRLLSATISRLRGSSGSECGRNLFAHQQRVDEQYGCALPPLLMMLLRLALNEPLSKSPWGYPERCMSLYEGYLCNISDAYQGMTQMVMCQLPLPYVQLCKACPSASQRPACVYVCSFAMARGLQGAGLSHFGAFHPYHACGAHIACIPSMRILGTPVSWHSLEAPATMLRALEPTLELTHQPHSADRPVDRTAMTARRRFRTSGPRQLGGPV